MLPGLLLIGLWSLQWALVFHARHALEFALLEAARAGSVANARTEAVDAGLARGLAPYLYGSGSVDGFAAARTRALAHVAAGHAAGWLRLRQLSPTAASFEDWAEAARDAAGQPVTDIDEIPNDNLVARASLQQPMSGVGGMRGAAPIGRVSRQTLADANVLKLELEYGVPLIVPLVGRLGASWLSMLDGCRPASAQRLALTTFAAPELAARAWTCSYYFAPDEAGREVPRWPLRLSATVRMQSPARRSALLGEAGEAAWTLGSDAGSAGAPDAAETAPVARPETPGNADEVEPFASVGPLASGAGDAAGPTDAADRGAGFLAFGSPVARPAAADVCLLER